MTGVSPQMLHQGAAGPVNIDWLLLLEPSVACLALFMRKCGLLYQVMIVSGSFITAYA